MTPYESIRGVINACQVLPNVVTGGQPGPSHLQAFKAAGGSVVLDVRAPHEPRPMDEPRLAGQLGLHYVNIPVGPTPLTDQLLEQILAVLRNHAGETLFFHCGSGNRVAGALIPYLILDHGLDESDAIAMAERAGLGSPQLLHWGLGYARRQRA